MRMWAFANRNTKELLRDPLNLAFMLGFPLVLLLLLSVIQSNIPVPLFEIQHLAPGITVFGLSFVTLFSASIIAKDRSSALLQRLYTTPMRSVDFILAYTAPLIPISMGQCLICYMVALPLDLPFTANIFYSVLFTAPISLLYIAIGLLCGSLLNDKQVGGVCGALLTNVSAWLSGIWFDLDIVGGTFQKIAHVLPFVHAVDLQRAVLAGNFGEILPHLLWVLGYAIILMAAAIFLFLRQMKKQ